jgi:hypothetical protein
MPRLPYFLLPLLAAALAAGEPLTAVHDDFTGYRNGSLPLPGWLTTGRWEVADGALRGIDSRRSFASPAGCAYGGTVAIEADLTPTGATGGDWKNCGIAVFSDPANYWLLSLTGFPGPDGKRIIELGEMLDGRWQAHAQGATALATWPPARSGTWSEGRTWHLRLVTGADGVRGSVADDTGQVVWEQGYRFDAAKTVVRNGMPLLWNQAWDCRFDNVTARISDPVPEPATAIHRVQTIPLSPLLPGEITVRDDFSGSGEEQAPSSAWRCPGVFWETKRGALRNADKGRAFAVRSDVRNSSTVLIEADVTALQAVGGSWKNAGVAVMQDQGAYWLLALTEAPSNGKAPPKHLIELNQMRAGRWQAQNNGDTTLAVHGPQKAGSWSTGTAVKLRLELTPAWIHGTAFSASGEVLWQQGYAFDAAKPSVSWGIPALWNSGFDCSWDEVVIAQSGLLAQPAFTANEKARGPDVFQVLPYDAPAMIARTFPATGFFHLVEQDGVSWLADPNGNAFFSLGVEQVKWGGHYSPALGLSPYNRNIKERYGSEAAWAAETSRRLRDWGFNTIGGMRGPFTGGASRERLAGLSYSNLINLGAGFVAFSDLSPVTINGFPNVFHPRWQEYCDAKAVEFCSPLKDDPWLLGYYIDNELDWHGSNVAAFFVHTMGGKPLEYGLILDVLNKPTDHSARLAFFAFLAGRHRDIAGLNKVWGTTFRSFDEITAKTLFTLGDPLPASHDDMREFLRLIADRYYAGTTSAIRKADPNHLIIGNRCAGSSQDVVMESSGRYCDVISINHYPFADLAAGTIDSARTMLARAAELCKRPILLSEWSFLSLDSGLPCQHGAGERFDTEAQRAEAFRIYQSLIAEQPFVVGSDYFMWVDDPAGGVSSASNPEDCSYGLVNEKDQPYPLVTAMAKRINSEAGHLHAQIVPPLHIDAENACLVLDDRLALVRDGVVELWEDGVRRDVAVKLGAGVQRLPLLADAKTGPHYVMARIAITGLIASDRQAAFIDATVWRGQPATGRMVTVANPGTDAITDYVSRLCGEDLGGPCRIAAWTGGTVTQQLQAGDTGSELLFLIEKLPARTALYFRLEPAADTQILTPQPLTLPAELANGQITLRKQADSPLLLDTVSLGEVQLGKMECMAWLKSPQNQWVRANRALRSTVIRGPVETTLECTVALDQQGPPAAMGEVDASGKIAAPIAPSGSFQATYRLRLPHGVPYYLIQFRSFTNTGSTPMNLQCYYHHMPSAIGGDTKGDFPENSELVTEYYNPTLLWFDDQVGAGYGVARPRSMFGSTFYIDPAGRQHADLSRSLRMQLAPGQAYVSTTEPEVPVFGCSGTASERPWEAVTRDLKARDAVIVQVGGR